MINPFNSPLEVGMRVLVILTEFFPEYLDINRLVLFDYALLYSSDFDGPESSQLSLPNHADRANRLGGFGVKRQHIMNGLRLMIRAELVEVGSSEYDGITYQAGEDAENFLSLLKSEYLHELRNNAHWVGEKFTGIDDSQLQEYMQQIFSSWFG